MSKVDDKYRLVWSHENPEWDQFGDKGSEPNRTLIIPFFTPDKVDDFDGKLLENYKVVIEKDLKEYTQLDRNGEYYESFDYWKIKDEAGYFDLLNPETKYPKVQVDITGFVDKHDAFNYLKNSLVYIPEKKFWAFRNNWGSEFVE